MKNFNNEDLDKYEKMAKNAISKFQLKTNTSFKIPKLKLSYIVSSLVVSGLTYIAYRIYDYKKYTNEHYIDVFQMKRKISNEIQMQDLYSKLKNFSLKENLKQATQKYSKKIQEECQKIIVKIQDKRPLDLYFADQQQQNNNKQSSKNQKKNLVQIILSKNSKPKLDLGYFFKLHTKQNVSSLRSSGQYVKKTYNIPILLFNVPFFSKKREQFKNIYKKGKLSQTLKTKQHFDFSSECQKINYWNSFNFSQQNRKITQNSSQVQEQKQPQNNKVKQTFIHKQQKHQILDKRQLIFECREKIRSLQNQFVKRLSLTIQEKWHKQKKNKNFKSNHQFMVTKWEQTNNKES